jgi:hypothetical protein
MDIDEFEAVFEGGQKATALLKRWGAWFGGGLVLTVVLWLATSSLFWAVVTAAGIGAGFLGAKWLHRRLVKDAG